MSTQFLKQKMIMLRGRAVRRAGAPFEGGMARLRAGILGGETGHPDAELSVEIAELSAHEKATAAADPTVFALAPAMPLKLIAPVATSAPPGAAPAAGATWGVKAVKADTSTFDGSGVVVAVLDTGIDANHPAFAGVQLVQRDFTGEGNGDSHGHGTHCAGTIFGRDVNGRRIGVARGVQKALVGKVLGQNSGGGSDLILDAINWAVSSGANVISMSLGIDFPGYVAFLVSKGMALEAATSEALFAYAGNVNLFQSLAASLQSATFLGRTTLLVAASGNESNRPAYEIHAGAPSSAVGIVSVGAVGRSAMGLEIAPFSNTSVNIAGPGVDVESAGAGGTGLVSMSGTSMATPHVAGVAALWAQSLMQQGNFTPALHMGRLLASGVLSGFAPGLDPQDVGAGLVQSPGQPIT